MLMRRRTAGAATERHGCFGVLVFADEAADFVEELHFGDSTAVDLDVRGGPEFAHTVTPPHFDAL